MVAQPLPLIDRGLYIYNYTYFHYIPLNIPLNPNKSLYFHIYIYMFPSYSSILGPTWAIETSFSKASYFDDVTTTTATADLGDATTTMLGMQSCLMVDVFFFRGLIICGTIIYQLYQLYTHYMLGTQAANRLVRFICSFVGMWFNMLQQSNMGI